VLLLSFTRIDDNVTCKKLTGDDLKIKGLRREVVVECARETRRLEACTVDDRKHALSCVGGVASCKYTESPRDESELDVAPQRLRTLVYGKLRRAASASEGRLTLGPDGRLLGTEVPDDGEDSVCKKSRPAAYSLFESPP